MKVGSIIGLACVAAIGLGATGTLIYVGSHRPQPIDLPRSTFVKEFQVGNSNVREYRLDNRDGNGVSKVTAGFEAEGAAKSYCDGFVVYDFPSKRKVSVQVPPTFLGTFAGKHRYRSVGGREYDLRGKTKPSFDTLQVIVVEPRRDLLSIF